MYSRKQMGTMPFEMEQSNMMHSLEQVDTIHSETDTMNSQMDTMHSMEKLLEVSRCRSQIFMVFFTILLI